MGACLDAGHDTGHCWYAVRNLMLKRATRRTASLESLTHLWDCVSSLQLSFYYGSRKFESKENIESKSTTVKKNGQLTTAKQNMVPSMVILKNDCNIVHILGGKRIKR